MNNIDEILARVERLDPEATPGKWFPSADRKRVIRGGVVLARGLSRADAVLIAAYRSDAPALAAEVRRLRKALTGIEATAHGDNEMDLAAALAHIELIGDRARAALAGGK